MSEAAAAISGSGQQGGGDGGQQQGQQGGGDGGQQQQQQQGAGGDGQQQQQQGDRWQDKFLPDDLKTNEAVGVFKDIPSLAKAFVEQQAWARGRVAIPKLGENPTDADKAAYATAVAEFSAKVRPEKAEDYVIPVPEGQSSATADYFRGKFHEIGLMGSQATAVAESYNQYIADQVSAKTQAGKSELTAIELDMGTPAYNQRLTAVGNMLDGMGIEVMDLVPALEQMASHYDESGNYQPGAGKAMRALFALAEKMGELGKVDGVDVQILGGNLSPEQAQTELDKMNGDPNLATDQAMQKRRKALMQIVADGRRAKK